MLFQVECFENADAFGPNSPVIWTDAAQFENAPLRRVHNFVIEAESAASAVNEAFAIGNAPWAPEDAEGRTWDHTRVRSMSTGDVVVVHTPDGPVAYGCLSWDWALLPPSMLPAGVESK